MKKAKELPVGNLILILVIFTGLLVRFSFYKSIDGAIKISDTPTYIGGAINLYNHLSLSEYRPPVYPLGLMLMGFLFTWNFLDNSVIVMQILLSMINILYIYKLVCEIFKNRPLAYFTAFITAISFRVYNWDFTILTENFSILIVTLITYNLVLFLKYNNRKHFSIIIVLLITAIFTKPFFLALPFAVSAIIIIKYLICKEKDKQIFIKLCSGFALIYICVFIYSTINYCENSYFGLTTVGNVNCFGKILQYNMEDTGNNSKLKADIKTALKNEKPEFIVDGKYLEPWHFIGCYGWTKDHYREINRFSKEIILKHPLKYITESIKLTFNLFVYNSPFKDFIADFTLIKAGHPDTVMLAVRKATDILDSLYILLVLYLIEVIVALLAGRKNNTYIEKYTMSVIILIILYHYAVSAFFSYGDYCRLLVPCYPLIYIIICRYLYVSAMYIFSNTAKVLWHRS